MGKWHMCLNPFFPLPLFGDGTGATSICESIAGVIKGLMGSDGMSEVLSSRERARAIEPRQ